MSKRLMLTNYEFISYAGYQALSYTNIVIERQKPVEKFTAHPRFAHQPRQALW